MKRIETLTPEQEVFLPHFIDKWLSMPTRQFSEDETRNTVEKMYLSMGKSKPIVLFFDSPLACEIIGNFLHGQLHSQLHGQLGSQLDSQLDRQLHSQLGRQLDSQLGRQLHSQLGSQETLAWLGYCNIWWFVWAGFYDIGKYIGVEFNEEAFDLFNDYNAQVVYAVPLEGFCIVSRKPKSIQWKNQQLHTEGSQAVEFNDGWGWYAYEGVRIPEKYGAVPVSKWKPEWIDEERNADVRAKLLKGIGFERWLETSGGKTIHEQEIFGLPYKLVIKEDPDIGTMKFLHMKNPSVPGVYHLEPVAPHSWIKTCEDALFWRLGAEGPEGKYNLLFAA